jgi:nucleoid-associated protein YgaU
VRIDQVDPVSGEVRNRSEVPFTFPTALAGAPAVAGATTLSRSPEAEALVGKRVADLAKQQEHATPPPASAAGAAPSATPAAPTPRDLAAMQPPVAAKPETPAVAPGAPGARVYVPELATLTVSHGDNLWSISRKSYGRGARYTVIYDANQDQIRNPSLIYPGQIFVLPQSAGSEGHQAEKR